MNHLVPRGGARASQVATEAAKAEVSDLLPGTGYPGISVGVADHLVVLVAIVEIAGSAVLSFGRGFPAWQ